MLSFEQQAGGFEEIVLFYEIYKGYITKLLSSREEILYNIEKGECSMANVYNIYCDESCHLEHDLIPVMLLGAIWCPSEQRKSISNDIRQLKDKHHAKGELKWTKVSNSRFNFYQELLDYFFTKEGINFRCLVVTDKERLNHSYFNQGSHDSFYYKMYYQLLLNIVCRADSKFNIYLDIKDTRGSRRIRELRRILNVKLADYKRLTVSQIQLIHSHESELIQFTDFLIGAVAYCNRNDVPKENHAKCGVIEKVREFSGIDLLHSTPPWEEKFNLFVFHPRRLNDG